MQGLLEHASSRTTAMYTHVSAKLIAQTRSPLDLLTEQGNGQKALPVPAQQKPETEAKSPAKKRRPANRKRSREQQSPSPKKTSGACCRTRTLATPFWAGTSNSVTIAVINESPATLAATGTAPSTRDRPRPAGCRPARQSRWPGRGKKPRRFAAWYQEGYIRITGPLDRQRRPVAAAFIATPTDVSPPDT